MANYGFSIDTAANWKTNNPTPNADEMCVESDTRFAKLGDGTTAYNSLSYLTTNAALAGIYGDGSDGNVTISGTTTLTRDMVYDTLTVSNGGVLKPNGFRIQCKTSLVVNSGGSINNDGNAASGSTRGNTLQNSAGTLTGGGLAGGTTSTTNGSAGTAALNSLGGSGGAGGTGLSGGGAGGVSSAAAANYGSLRTLPGAALGGASGTSIFSSAFNGGSGGGGGGGTGSVNGGGGGSGGGVLLINARIVSNSGTISCNGGAGAAAPAANTGGGGGGGGGFVVVNTAYYAGSNPTANGGAGGAIASGLGAGVAGSAGTVLVNVWA